MSAHALRTYFGESLEVVGKSHRPKLLINGAFADSSSRLFELHEIGLWHGAACTGIASYQQLAWGWYCYIDGKSFLKARQPELCSLLTHIFLFVYWFSPRTHTFPFCRFDPIRENLAVKSVFIIIRSRRDMSKFHFFLNFSKVFLPFPLPW